MSSNKDYQELILLQVATCLPKILFVNGLILEFLSFGEVLICYQLQEPPLKTPLKNKYESEPTYGLRLHTRDII